jgi:arylsulfatase
MPVGHAFAGAVVLAAALAAPAHADARSRPYRTVVLVTIDTLRADHLGAYGDARGLTPSIDALAANAVAYDRALATCPATAPSVASLLTGHHRAAHGVVRNGNRLAPRVTTLAERLRADGFRTAAVVANQVLAHTGYDQGFESFTVAAPDPVRPVLFRDGPLVKAAGRWIRAHRNEPFFVWVHLMAPHGPYQPPPVYLRGLGLPRFVRPGDHPLPLGHGVHALGALLRYQYLGGPVVPGEYRRRYAAEIRYADAVVGMLMRRLQRAGRWDDALVVLTADHGESLGEHDLWFQHGWFVYDDTLRVPLLVRAPGRTVPDTRVTTTVSLVDVMPTMLDLLGLAAPPDLEGVPLLPRTGAPPVERAAFAENYYENHLATLTVGPWKYVRTPRPTPPRRPNDPRRIDIPPAGREELYDVRVDPGETHDLVEAQPAVAARLGRHLDDWLAGQRERRLAAARAPTPPEPAVDPRHRRELDDALRALGYVE